MDDTAEAFMWPVGQVERNRLALQCQEAKEKLDAELASALS